MGVVLVAWCWFVGPFVCGGGFVVGVRFFVFLLNFVLWIVVRAPTQNGALKYEKRNRRQKTLISARRRQASVT